MKGSVICPLVCLAVIGFIIGIAGAIVMAVSNENKCGDGCRADNCMTQPCTCGMINISCEDYAVKSDNAGNKSYMVGVALLAAGFGSFALIILSIFIYGMCSSWLRKQQHLPQTNEQNPPSKPEEINMVMSPGVQNN